MDPLIQIIQVLSYYYSQNSGAPRAKPVAPDERPCGATPRPKVHAFIRGQRPWLSAAGVKNRSVKSLLSSLFLREESPSLAIFFLPHRQARGARGDFPMPVF